MNTKPQAIADVLKTLMAKASKEEEKYLVMEKMWQETAGANIIKHTKPVSLKKGVLSINVDSSAWLFQLNILRRNLLKELKKRLGDDVKDIKFKIGPIV